MVKVTPSPAVIDMKHYREIGTGWPETPITVAANHTALTKREVKALVNENQWAALGKAFNFTPVYHFTSERWIDWRCVPESLMKVLQGDKFVRPVAANPKLHKRKIKRLHSERNGWDEPTKTAARKFKELLHETQGGICHYCNRHVTLAEWSVDHRMPYFRGGTNAKTNRIGCCRSCNGHKAFLTEEEFIALQPGTRGIAERCKAQISRLTKEFQPRVPDRSREFGTIGIGT